MYDMPQYVFMEMHRAAFETVQPLRLLLLSYQDDRMLS